MNDIKQEFWRVAQESLDKGHKYMSHKTKESIIQERWDVFVNNFITDYALNYAWGNWTNRR